MAHAAYVAACKFHDVDGDGSLNNGELLLSGWEINATGVVGLNGATADSQLTGAEGTGSFGCVTWTVVPDTNGNYPTVTFTETQQSGWVQTAPNPANSPFTDYTSADVNGVWVATVNPLSDNKTVTVYFGNNDLSADEGLTVSKTAIPTVNYTWGISKDVDKTTVNIADGGTATFNYTVSVTHASSAWTVSGDITLASTLSVPVSGLTVSDDPGNGGSCTITPSATGVSVPAHGSTTLHYNCTFASAPSTGTNSVTAKDGNNDAVATFDLPYDFAGATCIDGSVTVTDTLGGTLGTVKCSDPSPKTFTYPVTQSGVAGTCTSYDNTATFKTDTNGTTGDSNKVTVQVCVGKNLTVSKTATPRFTRTYNWSITKAADKTLVENSSGSYTFTYTVVASETGFTDSAWQVTGKITVSNPNDWEAITVNPLSDAIDNGGTCTINGGGTSFSVPASSSVDKYYTCTYSAAPSPAAFTNTATATWDKATYYTLNGSASGSKSGAFGDPTTTVNKTIHVTDTYGGEFGNRDRHRLDAVCQGDVYVHTHRHGNGRAVH